MFVCVCDRAWGNGKSMQHVGARVLCKGQGSNMQSLFTFHSFQIPNICDWFTLGSSKLLCHLSHLSCLHNIPLSPFVFFPPVELTGFAKAPAKHVVELAQAEVRQNPAAPNDLKEFSRVRLEDAETGAHHVFQKYNLVCKVQVDQANLGDNELKEFPYIKLSSWLQYLSTSRIFRQFCGVATFSKMKLVLREFWQRYHAINPSHEIFERARQGGLDLESTIPYYSHSDEGRSYKKEALWIFSVHGCLGRGTNGFLKRRKHLPRVERNQMGMNFVGPTLSTQFLFATMLREKSKQNPGSMEKLLEIFALDAKDLYTQGFRTQEGYHLWCVHLGTKGDLPALAKIGNFVRTWLHVPRAPRSRKACEGICPRCLAGQERDDTRGMQAFPFEDLSRSPGWVSTIDRVDPFHTLPPLLQGVPLNRDWKTKFFNFDIWHIFHLGIAKGWIGSSLVVIIESDIPVLSGQRSVEAKFGQLTDMYKHFCRSNKLAMWVSELSRESLSWPQSSANPLGAWNKGSASTTLMLFLGWFAQAFIKGKTDNEQLLLIASRP